MKKKSFSSDPGPQTDETSGRPAARWVGLVWLAARIFLGLVFAYSGFVKLVGPVENFQAAVAEYPVIPHFLIPLIAVVSPWFEYVFGAFLILGYAPRLSALALAFFSFGFLILVMTRPEFWTGKEASCGCFGDGWFRPTLRQIFKLDLVDVLIGVRLFCLKGHLWSLDGILRKKGT